MGLARSTEMDVLRVVLPRYQWTGPTHSSHILVRDREILELEFEASRCFRQELKWPEGRGKRGKWGKAG